MSRGFQQNGRSMRLAIEGILVYPVGVSGFGLPTAFAASFVSGVLVGIYPWLKAATIHSVCIIRS